MKLHDYANWAGILRS